MFVVPTIGFKLLYGIVIMRLNRRRLVWTNVTTNPTAEWIARQITEAFPLGSGSSLSTSGSRQVLRDTVRRRLQAMGIRDHPTRATLAVAEWPCRAAHRIDPARVPRSHCGFK